LNDNLTFNNDNIINYSIDSDITQEITFEYGNNNSPFVNVSNFKELGIISFIPDFQTFGFISPTFSFFTGKNNLIVQTETIENSQIITTKEYTFNSNSLPNLVSDNWANEFNIDY
jgi:hypothetical protein